MFLICRLQVVEESQAALAWLKEKQELQAQLGKHEDPVLVSADIKKKEDTLRRVADPIQRCDSQCGWCSCRLHGSHRFPAKVAPGTIWPTLAPCLEVWRTCGFHCFLTAVVSLVDAN